VLNFMIGFFLGAGVICTVLLIIVNAINKYFIIISNEEKLKEAVEKYARNN